jgi:hypothetical protein
VLFSHKVPERGEGEETSRSFLIIDGELTSGELVFWMPRTSSLNADKPEVIAEVELIESEDTHVPSYLCSLESKGSYLPARRSPETRDPDKWDLAVAGLHKRQAGTETVKRLKHVIIQFDTQNSKFMSDRIVSVGRSMLIIGKDLSQFTTKFKQVQDLAKLRLAQFLQATGQG